MQIYSDAIGHCEDAPQASDTASLNRNDSTEAIKAETATTLPQSCPILTTIGLKCHDKDGRIPCSYAAGVLCGSLKVFTWRSTGHWRTCWSKSSANCCLALAFLCTPLQNPVHPYHSIIFGALSWLWLFFFVFLLPRTNKFGANKFKSCLCFDPLNAETFLTKLWRKEGLFFPIRRPPRKSRKVLPLFSLFPASLSYFIFKYCFCLNDFSCRALNVLTLITGCKC